MVNHEAREVGYYNNRGQLVFSRPANEGEAQKTLMSISREAI